MSKDKEQMKCQVTDCKNDAKFKVVSLNTMTNYLQTFSLCDKCSADQCGCVGDALGGIINRRHPLPTELRQESK